MSTRSKRILDSATEIKEKNDCHLYPLLQSWGGYLIVPVRAMGPFWPGDSPFRAVCVCLVGGWGGACGLCPKSRAWRARLSFRGLSCWEASVTLYLWFRF